MKPAIKKIVKTIIDSANPNKIILFGSQSRGDAHRSSDYDFMVIKEGVKNEREVSRKVYRALFSKNINKAVDVIVVDPVKLKQYQKNTNFVYRQALKQGQVVYG